MDSSWSEERTNRAIELWREGRSASDIATVLGGVSRNAVIGKINRLVVAGKMQARPDANRLPPPARPAALRSPSLKLAHDAHRARVQPDRPAPHESVALAEPIPIQARSVLLHELEANECKWPVGDGRPARFCGCPTARLKSYCAHHSRASEPRDMRQMAR